MKATLVTNKVELQKVLKKVHLKRIIEYSPESALAVFYSTIFTPRNPVYLSAQILSVSKFIQAKWYFFDWKPTFARICKAVTTTVYEVCRIHAFYFIRTALPILRWLKKSSRDFFPINPTPPSLPIGHRLKTMGA